MSNTMKAMVYYGANDIRFEERPIPTILALMAAFSVMKASAL